MHIHLYWILAYLWYLLIQLFVGANQTITNTADWILSLKGYYIRDHTCFCMHLKGNLTKYISGKKKILKKKFQRKMNHGVYVQCIFCPMSYCFWGNLIKVSIMCHIRPQETFGWFSHQWYKYLPNLISSFIIFHCILQIWNQSII